MLSIILFQALCIITRNYSDVIYDPVSGCVLLLGIILMLSMIQEFLPEAHPNLPYLGICIHFYLKDTFFFKVLLCSKYVVTDFWFKVYVQLQYVIYIKVCLFNTSAESKVTMKCIKGMWL